MKIDFKLIKKLREELEEFLKDKPELRKLQDEIDTRMSKCDTQHNRCAVIQEMMLESNYRIVDASTNLNEAFNEFCNPSVKKLEVVEEFTHLGPFDLNERCDNCEEYTKEEDLQEVYHTETREHFFVCEKCRIL